MYKIIKKDGSEELFDRNKIVGGVIKSGGSAGEAERVAVAVENWLPEVVAAGPVTSGQIRARVLEILKQVSPTAAANFETFKKPVADQPSESAPDQ